MLKQKYYFSLADFSHSGKCHELCTSRSIYEKTMQAELQERNVRDREKRVGENLTACFPEIKV